MLKIPKILHLYWDENRMSQLQTLTVDSFHRLNPDWEINIYKAKQPYLGSGKYVPDYTGKDYFHLVEKMEYVNIEIINLDDYDISYELHGILRSDIVRYHKLYEYGGVWSDFDVVWLKPMNHFYNIDYVGNTQIKEIDGVVSFSKNTGGFHSIGVMIHRKQDDYILSLIEETKRVRPPYNHQSFGSAMIGSMYLTFELFNDKFPNIIGALYETYYPYSVSNFCRTRLYGEIDLTHITKNTMCVHWFNGHASSKAYVNGEGFDRECSMTAILKNEKLI